MDEWPPESEEQHDFDITVEMTGIAKVLDPMKSQKTAEV